MTISACGDDVILQTCFIAKNLLSKVFNDKHVVLSVAMLAPTRKYLELQKLLKYTNVARP